MQRPIGIGVIGFGWMGHVHSSAYRRVLEHYSDLGVSPRLVIACDLSEDRLRQAELFGFETTTQDWRSVAEHQEVEAISVTVPNNMHREVAITAMEAGKHVWVEKPVGRGVDDTAAVAEVARRTGVVNAVGFCYRFAPAVQHARKLILAGELGDLNHYRGVFLAAYANRPDTAASWRFLRADAGSGALGDLMAHVVDMAHYIVGPIESVSGRTATMITHRPRLPVGRGTHFSRLSTTDLVEVENEDWAAAMLQFGGGTFGTLEASRVIVGPQVRMRFEVHGTRGALAWELERMNELELFQTREDGADEGYMTVLAGVNHPDFAAFQPGAGIPMGYDDLRVIEAGHFLAAVRDREQRGPGVDEMLACARVLDAIQRSNTSGRWEPAR